MVRKALRRAARVVVVLCVIAGGAYAVKTQLLDDDGHAPAAVSLSVRVLAPGTFTSAHPYAPYYVVPRRRFSDPSKLTRLARNKLVTKPESALSKGAMAGSPQIVRLALRATSGDPVTVDGVRFTIVSDARPLRGWYTALTSCMVRPVPRATVELDARHATARYVGTGGARSRALALTVAPGAPRVLELQASTRRRRVAWTAQLSIRDGAGRASSIAIDDRGAPFRVTSARASRAYRPIYGASGIIGYARERGLQSC